PIWSSSGCSARSRSRADPPADRAAVRARARRDAAARGRIDRAGPALPRAGLPARARLAGRPGGRAYAPRRRPRGRPGPRPALVYPNLRAVQRYELQVRSGRAAEAGLRRTRLAGGGTELERLREYVPDDEYRRIAWKATARRHAPIVVEHETERSQNVILAVDAGRLMAA